jgi:mycofactocin precursor
VQELGCARATPAQRQRDGEQCKSRAVPSHPSMIAGRPSVAGGSSPRGRYGIVSASPTKGRKSVMSEPQAQPPAELESEETPAQPADDEVVDDELLVEEVSIDGMCGVY